MPVPLTVATYALNGVQRDFDVPFDYLSPTFIRVRLLGAGVPQVLSLGTDYTFLTNTTIRTTIAHGAPDWQYVEIRRVTPSTDLIVEFSDASVLRASDLSLSTLQTLHVAEEARDSIQDTLAEDLNGNIDARSRRIVNVDDPVGPTDAVNLQTLDQFAYDAGLLQLSGTTVPAAGFPEVPSVVGAGNLSVAINAITQALTDRTSSLNDKLDGAPLFADTYSSIRGYSGQATTALVYGRDQPNDGGAGAFHVDPTDLTSVDTGGDVLVDVLGRRWKREFYGPARLSWYADKGAEVSSELSAAFVNNCAIDFDIDCSIAATVRKTADDILLISSNNSTVTMATSFGIVIGDDSKDANGYHTTTSPTISNVVLNGLTVEADAEDSRSVGVAVYGCRNVVVYQSSFGKFKVEGLLIGAGCVDVQVGLSEFYEEASTAESKGLTVIHYVSGYVDSPTNTSSFVTAARATTFISRVSVSCCTFRRTRLQASNVDGLLVSSCTFNNPASRGINMSPFVTNSLVTGCVFNIGATTSTGVNISQACTGIVVSGCTFQGGTSGAARCINVYYGSGDVSIAGCVFRSGSTRDITIAVNAYNVTVTGCLFAPTTRIGDNILITALDSFNPDTTMGSTATDSTSVRNISVVGCVFAVPRARCVYVKAQRSSSAGNNPLNVNGVSIVTPKVWNAQLSFVSGGDGFLRVDSDGSTASGIELDSVLYSKSSPAVPDHTRFDITETLSNGGTITYAALPRKSARFAVVGTSGSWAVTRVGGDPHITLAVGASGSDLVINGRYLVSTRGTIQVTLGDSNFATSAIIQAFTASPDPVYRFLSGATPVNMTTASGKFFVDVFLTTKP